MSWECACGIVNKDEAIVCAGCGWTIARSKAYIADPQDVSVAPPPRILSTAWGIFKRLQVVVILYVFTSLGIKYAGELFLPGPWESQPVSFQTDIPLMGLGVLKFWLYCGLLRVALDAVRGYRFNRRKLITPLSEFFSVSVVIAVLFMPLGLGFQLTKISGFFFLLLIPGIYLLLMWSQFCLLLLENKARYFDALSLSAKMTKHKKGMIISAFIVPMLIALPADIAGEIFSQPKGASMVGDGLSTVILLLVGSWQFGVGAFLAVVEAVLYQELLTN